MKLPIFKLTVVLLLVFLLISPSARVGASSGANWLQFNFDAQHSGYNPSETTLSSANVSQLAVAFKVALPGVADGAPVFLSGVVTPQGVRDVLYLTTKDGYILAVDARSGAGLWSHQNGPGACRINNSGGPCYTTSSPVIDPNLQYVYSYGLDGYVHKYRVGDGVEVQDSHWPELVSLKPFDEKGSSALSTATVQGTSYLYVSSAGYPGDRGDYQGHVTVINLSDGTQKVFNAACSNQPVHFQVAPQTPNCPLVQTAVWSRPGVVYDPATSRVYFATGNGTYDPSRYGWGDSVLAIQPDGSGANGMPLDSYTPTDFQSLDNRDADLGSTSPAILPVPAGSKYAHIAVQGGKDQLLRLINLDNLSGQGGPGHTGGELGAPIPVPQGGGVFATPAVWVNPSNGQTWVFVTTANGISGLRLVIASDGMPGLQPEWQKQPGGTSPVIANGVLYYASSGKISALDPLTGSPLWSSSQIGAIHWESPIVIDGRVYLSDQSGQLTAFAIPSDLNFGHRLFLPAMQK